MVGSFPEIHRVVSHIGQTYRARQVCIEKCLVESVFKQYWGYTFTEEVKSLTMDSKCKNHHFDMHEQNRSIHELFEQ